MLISDERFAAAWRGPGGDEQHFDDVGCLVSHYRAHDPGANARLFVRDFGGERWLDGRTAVFVSAPGVKSPMSYNVAAFASAEAARTTLGTRTAGTIQDWVVLLRDLQGRG
ncbi:MAG: nitrous oxide reductase accessory protein NosL [Dehalococcoidia bacterium]|nr:nitrous oxide reductase accessory protein NosL [Dehalococcoidia bacterium]